MRVEKVICDVCKREIVGTMFTCNGRHESEFTISRDHKYETHICGVECLMKLLSDWLHQNNR